MGTIVLLDRPGGCVYVGWSTYIDVPVMYGPRAELRAWLLEQRGWSEAEAEAATVLADATGTSDPGLLGSWGASYLVCREEFASGRLSRDKLVEYARAVCNDEQPEDVVAAVRLLEPFEEDDEAAV